MKFAKFAPFQSFSCPLQLPFQVTGLKNFFRIQERFKRSFTSIFIIFANEIEIYQINKLNVVVSTQPKELFKGSHTLFQELIILLSKIMLLIVFVF